MARNIVICFDGTNNQFGQQNTSIVRLIQVLDRTPGTQRLYYDPGVGTLPEPGTWSRTGKFLSKVIGLAFGGGIFWKVQQAYTYLMNVREPEDRIYVFGFSRGAYTARLLAAVLHELGLLPRGNDNLVPYVLRRFRAIPQDRRDDDAERRAAVRAHFAINDAFRETFAREAIAGDPTRRCPIEFLGLFDTVSSVGYAWEPRSYPYTKNNPSVRHVRHAIAIDERRWFFRQNRFGKAAQSVQQLWFAGVHSDVGGGYPPDHGKLWWPAFEWMVQEANGLGLSFDRAKWTALAQEVTSPPWREKQHESLTRGWWPVEFYPKRARRREGGPRRFALGLGRRRIFEAGDTLHVSVLRRLREHAGYNPSNLPPALVAAIKQIPAADLPPFLRYDG
jgi:uncharacterized protein (DUF2235 family)